MLTPTHHAQLAQKRRDRQKLQSELGNHEEFATMMLADAQTGNVEQIKQLLRREVNVNEVCTNPHQKGTRLTSQM